MEPVGESSKRLYVNCEPMVLASGSPRRREMLAGMGLAFESMESGVEELERPGEGPYATVERWAMQKARVVSLMRPDQWVLAADTIVLLDERIFGKPGDSDEALSMLLRLNGKAHEVVTAVALAHHGRSYLEIRSVRTIVLFRSADEREIRAYVRTGEPLDKAGSYGIQGLGAFLVRAIEGSYTNVVGLPLCETLEWLTEQRVIAPCDR